jgi:hypothetical protein
MELALSFPSTVDALPDALLADTEVCVQGVNRRSS